MEDQESFLAGYDPRKYPSVAVTVDVVALTIRTGTLCVLLVERGAQPFAGQRALPGGFVKSETLDDAALREFAEETGLTPGRGELDRVHLEQLKTYGNPGRDPRMRVVSVAYLAFAPSLPEPTAGSDAARAYWVPVDEAKDLAFDHDDVLADGLERARSKLEYTPLATAFVAEEFTVGELRQVYGCVWGEELHAGNFHRKVLSVPGFVESTGRTTSRGGERGGPKAKLYRAGDATLLHPALLRPTREDRVR
ncbi:putative NUDIX hydrolase [Actinoplanes missouriensis 431]|uniref:Putative NUDIX hydrolase n=1 Tax=Actinoplanes missouriensis (strain ATCC 14538 / DSM 43046 / CBS 188.64 / JCM 3121 / NBRC 102363 / NCIMB 12654 / NRRL B-3342 / UNCC 431) TaxID=512565 RepID=I0HFA3_ACTM4|nr:NUDIX domain-containing protein [Actinoplanes missouriensis]BAL91690.1 putative NUDIX hydrolase [Actinoplanes missouriensis 431]